MSLFEKLRTQATEVATTVVGKTQDTAKTGQLQLQLRNLRSEERDALVRLGDLAHTLVSEGRLDDAATELQPLVSVVTDVRERIAKREAELAAKRAEGDEEPADDGTVESTAEEISDASAEASQEGPPV
jgi:hypothetical protein